MGDRLDVGSGALLGFGAVALDIVGGADGGAVRELGFEQTVIGSPAVGGATPALAATGLF